MTHTSLAKEKSTRPFDAGTSLALLAYARCCLMILEMGGEQMGADMANLGAESADYSLDV